MTRIRPLLIFIWSLACANSALGSPLQEAKAFVCRSGPGVSTEWKDGQARTKETRNDITFTISEMDRSSRTARLSGPGGSGTIRVIATSPAALTFVESLSTGGTIITTVFALQGSSRGFPFVDSRHNTIFGEPIVSQYFGMCEGQF